MFRTKTKVDIFFKNCFKTKLFKRLLYWGIHRLFSSAIYNNIHRQYMDHVTLKIYLKSLIKIVSFLQERFCVWYFGSHSLTILIDIYFLLHRFRLPPLIICFTRFLQNIFFYCLLPFCLLLNTILLNISFFLLCPYIYCSVIINYSVLVYHQVTYHIYINENWAF